MRQRERETRIGSEAAGKQASETEAAVAKTLANDEAGDEVR